MKAETRYLVRMVSGNHVRYCELGSARERYLFGRGYRRVSIDEVAWEGDRD